MFNALLIHERYAQYAQALDRNS